MDKRKRLAFQGVASLVQNANFRGFFTGKIYAGAAKKVCVPGLNCYSCPGAVGSCPIGSLQNGLSGLKFRFPYYVVGLLIFFGALLGRAVCGFLCPYGLLQDLLYLIPVKKTEKVRGDGVLRKVKYAVLILLVIVLPICVKATPFFCKYLCPSGTVSGVLLLLSNRPLWKLMGGRWAWKVSVLLLILIASAKIFRPFCRYLCPLGAFYSLFNRFSLVRMSVDGDACVGCGKCARACGMGCDPVKDANDPECIRCGQCVSACPKKAISYENVFTYKGIRPLKDGKAPDGSESR